MDGIYLTGAPTKSELLRCVVTTTVSTDIYSSDELSYRRRPCVLDPKLERRPKSSRRARIRLGSACRSDPQGLGAITERSLGICLGISGTAEQPLQRHRLSGHLARPGHGISRHPNTALRLPRLGMLGTLAHFVQASQGQHDSCHE